MKVKHRAYVAFAYFFFVVSVAKEREERTFNAERRFDNIRDISFILVGIKVGKIFAGCVLMLCKVVIRSVGNAPKLAPSEREEKLKVCGCF